MLTTQTSSPSSPRSFLLLKEKDREWQHFIENMENRPVFHLGEKLHSHVPFSKLSLNRGSFFYHFVQDQIGSIYALTSQQAKGRNPWMQVAIESLVNSSLKDQRLEEISYDIYLFLKENNALASQNQELGTVAKTALYLLYQLITLSPQDRLNYLNHQRVKETFESFIRQLTARATSFLLSRSEESTEAIKEKSGVFGAQEALSFCRKLRLEFNQWALFENKWQWLHNPEGQDNPSLLDTDQLQLPTHRSCHLVLAINTTCCESLRLELTEIEYPETPSFTTDLPPQAIIPKISAYELLDDWRKNALKRFQNMDEQASYLNVDHLEGYFRDLEKIQEHLSNDLSEISKKTMAPARGFSLSKAPLIGIFQLCRIETIRSILSIFKIVLSLFKRKKK